MADKVPQIGQALCNVMAAINPIPKDKQAGGGSYGYKFRGIDDVYTALQPALIKCGVAVVPKLKSIQREDRVSTKGTQLIYTILHIEFTFICAEDGSSVTVATAGEAMDTGDKSCNKAMSAAYKYAMFQTLCIPTERGSNDSEDNTHEVAPPPPPPAPPAEPTEAERAEKGRAWCSHFLAEMGEGDLCQVFIDANLKPSAKIDTMTLDELNALKTAIVAQQKGQAK